MIIPMPKVQGTSIKNDEDVKLVFTFEHNELEKMDFRT